MNRMLYLIDIPYEEWNIGDRFKVLEKVQKYMSSCFHTKKNPYNEDVRVLELLDGRKIQYIKWVETMKINGEPYGYEDEIVYVGTKSSKVNNEWVDEKCFMGMNWKDDVDMQLYILSQIPIDIIHNILFTVVMHEVTSKTF